MHKAVYCCDGFPPADVVLGQYQSLGPQGGLVGGFYLMSMAL
jgi:hypothetical protein